METLLYGVAVLACPIGMGVMMWMMRGQHRDTSGSSLEPAAAEQSAEINALRAEIAQLKADRAGQPKGEATPAHGPANPPTTISVQS